MTGQKTPENPAQNSEHNQVLQVIANIEDLLRTGLDPRAVWHQVGVTIDDQGLPYQESLLSVLRDETSKRALKRASPSVQPTAVNQPQEIPELIAHILITVASIAHTTGMPLGTLLGTVHSNVRSALDSHEHRRIAMAGPKLSASILQLLPLIGVSAAYLIGVNPFVWFTQTPAGLVSAVCGCVLMWVGRNWTKRLISQAQGGATK